MLLAVDGYRFNGRRPRSSRRRSPNCGRPCHRCDATIVVAPTRPRREPRHPTAPAPRTGLTSRPATAAREPAFEHAPVRSSAVDPVLVGHNRSAQGHRPQPRRDPRRAPEVTRPVPGPAAQRPLPVLQLDELDGVELPGRWPLHGATIVLYDGSPAHASRDALWARRGDHAATTVLGMGSAYAAACQNAAVSTRHELGLDALRTVIPTGSPLAPAAGGGWSEQLGPRSGSTRSAAAPMSAPRSSVAASCCRCTGGRGVVPVAGRRCPRVRRGWSAELIGEVGEFVLTVPMPSMPIGLWGDRRRQPLPLHVLRDAIRACGARATGSRSRPAARSRFLGRSDATLNRGGVRHRLGGDLRRRRAPWRGRGFTRGRGRAADGGYYMPLFVVSERRTWRRLHSDRRTRHP